MDRIVREIQKLLQTKKVLKRLARNEVARYGCVSVGTAHMMERVERRIRQLNTFPV